MSTCPHVHRTTSRLLLTVRPVIDPHSGVPAWRQLADELRARITSGEWPPGALLPPQPRLRYEYAVSKPTVQAAVSALKSEGRVDVERGIGVRVREQPVKRKVRVPRGSETDSRMPDAAERAEMDIAEGVPLLLVTFGGETRRYPADRVTLTHS
jgi:DNA-binding transcriptional regulator YhcF (GntR family)